MEYSDSDETRSRLVSATAGLGPASAVFLPATVQRSTSALLLTHFPSPSPRLLRCVAAAAAVTLLFRSQ